MCGIPQLRIDDGLVQAGIGFALAFHARLGQYRFGLFKHLGGAIQFTKIAFNDLIDLTQLLTQLSYARKLVTALSGGGLNLFDAVDECNALYDLGHTVGTV